MDFAQICDLVEPPARTEEPMNLSAFAGTWVNSNADTMSIARLVISESGGKLFLRVYAIGPEGVIDWGAREIKIFTSSPSSRQPAGFTCGYDFDFAETTLQGMIMKGLLVLAQFHSFKDESRRADYFVREYFALAHGRF